MDKRQATPTHTHADAEREEKQFHIWLSVVYIQLKSIRGAAAATAAIVIGRRYTKCLLKIYFRILFIGKIAASDGIDAIK